VSAAVEIAMPDSHHALEITDRRSLADKVHVALTEMVLSGELGSGERVSIDHMARLLGVSATPVREALARLVSDGLVQGVPHRGYVVSGIWDTRTFDQMHEARFVVEPYGARVAARRVKEGTETELVGDLGHYLGLMIAIVMDFEREGVFLDKCREYADADRRFHEAIIDVCDNPVFGEVVRRLRPQPHLVHLYATLEIPFGRTIEEHRAIVDAIREGLEQEAGQAMQRHLVQVGLRLRPGTLGADGSIEPTAGEIWFEE
jgi:DNA-binding GntR family transcriptional regulator